MSKTDLAKWFPALMYEINKKDEFSILKLITKIFFINLTATLPAAYILSSLLGTGEEAAFFKESEAGGGAAVYNLLTFLFIVIIMSLFIYLLVKYRKFNVLELISLLLLAFISGSVASLIIPIWLYVAIYIYAQELIDIFLTFFDLLYWTVFILFFVLQGLTLIHERFHKLRNFLLIITTSWAGVFLGLYTGLLTPPILMLGFSIYDIYAVYRGPIRLITNELQEANIIEKNESKGLFILGLGDIFFYSMAISYSLAYFGFESFIVVSILLLIGVIATIILLMWKAPEGRELPALPIPLLFALIGIAISAIFL